MKSLLKKIGCTVLIMVILSMSTGISDVEALTSPIPDTFQGGAAVKLTKYIGNYQYFANYAADGTPIYCLESWKNPPRTVTFKKTEQLDSGILYILKNGYPNKSFTGDKNQDYFITNTAIWWYLDRINGTGDSTNGWLYGSFKTNASDSYHLREHIRSLMEGGMAHRSDSVSPDINVSMDSDIMTLSEDKKYFESEFIHVSSNAELNEYRASITNGTTNAKLVDENGVTKTTFSAGEKFKMVVPASEVKDLNKEFQIHITASTAIEVVYRYDSGNDTLQDVTPGIDKQWKPVEADITLKLTTTKIKISKQDITTKKELAGAHLVLRDSENNVIDEWVSTTQAHEIDFLPAGKYTLEETIAPEGYVLNKQKVEFELTTDGQIKEVVMYNEQIVEVPDTGTGTEMIIYIAGVGLLVIGIVTVYYYGKKQHI